MDAQTKARAQGHTLEILGGQMGADLRQFVSSRAGKVAEAGQALVEFSTGKVGRDMALGICRDAREDLAQREDDLHLVGSASDAMQTLDDVLEVLEP